MKTMNKRALRKFALPGRKPNPKNGVFCAEQVKYVVRTAIKNIDHRRTLVLYIYDRKRVLAGDLIPQWTMFQDKNGYITLNHDKKGSRWLRSTFENLGGNYNLRTRCSFYSRSDEDRIARFCRDETRRGFDSLSAFQQSLRYQKQLEIAYKHQRKIIERMKPIKALPKGIEDFMRREVLPQYIFYDYEKGKAPQNAYCTGCKQAVSVGKARHNEKGVCPHCKRAITFKSRGRRGKIFDRSTAQVIQRADENELVIRIVKAYCSYHGEDMPTLSIHENSRLFLEWDGNRIVKQEGYYYCYSNDRITPWHNGNRPVFSSRQYCFEADLSGYLYCRNLDGVLKGTPWQYSALKEYYFGDPTPLYVASYLQEYLRYPMLEYLVKLRLYSLATYVVYGSRNGPYGNNKLLNSHGKNVTEVLGVGKRYLPLLQEIDAGPHQLAMIQMLLREGVEPDIGLLRWCKENDLRNNDDIMTLLRYISPHKLMRYADEQFAAHRAKAYYGSGYHYMSFMLSDYKDYLCMCEGLERDMKSSFVLFPNDLKAEHDRVNDLIKKKADQAFDRRIANMFGDLQSRYGYARSGFLVVAPRSSKEIVREGDALHHCVGRYVEDVAKSKCVILFVRKASAPKKPFCTVEVKNGDVTQARMQDNQVPPPKVEKFISLWKDKVLYAPGNTRAA